MECSWNDGSKTQYYYVILDRLPGRSGGLEQAMEWCVRGPLTAKVIERMYFVLPSKGEQFFLRLLLTIFEGGKSWEHLRTWNGQVFATFKEAYMARGLLEDDHE